MNKKHKRSHMKGNLGNEKEGVLESDKELQLTPEEIERIKLVPFLEWLRGKRGRTVRWLILYGILLAILVTQVRLVYVTSESIPYTCCLQLYNVKPQVGDLCVFDFHLPLYKMINVLSAYKRAEFDLRDYTDVVTMDFIYRYIGEILDVMLAETANLRNAQVSDEEIGRFMKQIQRAKDAINQKRQDAYEQMNQALLLIENTKTYEKKLENTFNALQKGMVS